MDASLPPVVPPNTWARIKEHKIIQWSLGYLAAALALTHSEELIGHAYGWPESIGQILIALLGIGLPVAVTLAWYHGARGLRRVGAGELLIITLLGVIAGSVLWSIENDRDKESHDKKAELGKAAAAAQSAAVPESVATTDSRVAFAA